MKMGISSFSHPYNGLFIHDVSASNNSTFDMLKQKYCFMPSIYKFSPFSLGVNLLLKMFY